MLSGQAGEYDKLWSKKDFFGGNADFGGKRVGKMANVPIITNMKSGVGCLSGIMSPRLRSHRQMISGELSSHRIVALTDMDGRDKRIGTADVICRLAVLDGQATTGPRGLTLANHSTVTDFARLRGWSTSVPSATAV
jgi:hypothetical protein